VVGKMNIILLGPPGAGKGTQALLLCEKFSIGHISTGEMLRQAIYHRTELGLKAQQATESGKLVSDDLIINLVRNEISKPQYKNGFLLDGFPRNLVQAKSLQNTGIKIDFIIYLNVDDQIIIDRLSGRRYHLESGRVYHVKYSPPKQLNVDDITGEQLVIRKDDQEEIIRQRLNVYHQITKPLINWYETKDRTKFINIDASSKQPEIFSKIIELVS
jgi:adenylate kinase